jgi:hypothetical protein
VVSHANKKLRTPRDLRGFRDETPVNTGFCYEIAHLPLPTLLLGSIGFSFENFLQKLVLLERFILSSLTPICR